MRSGGSHGRLAAPAQAYIYWSDDTDNTIARATLDGVQVQQLFIQGVSNPGQVVVDASHIYWFNRGDGAIGRANIDGSGVNPDFIPGAAAAGPPSPRATATSSGPTSRTAHWDGPTSTAVGRARSSPVHVPAGRRG